MFPLQIFPRTCLHVMQQLQVCVFVGMCMYVCIYEGWNFNSGNFLFTTDTK